MLNKLPPLNKREKILLSLVLVSVVFAFNKFIYSKQKVEISKLEQNIKDLRSNLNSKKSQFSEMSNRKPASDGLSIPAKTFLVPGEENGSAAILVDYLTTPPQDINIDIEKIEIKEMKEVLGFNKYKLQINVQGSFINIGKLLDYFEELSFLTDISSVEILEVSNDLLQCTGKIIINGYVLKDEE